MKSTEDMAVKYQQFMDRRESEKTCDKHGVCLWVIQRPSPDGLVTSEFCPECQKEVIQETEEIGIRKGLVNAKLVQTYKIFSRESIIPDDLKGASLQNFDIDTEFDTKALNFARRICRSYYDGGQGNTIMMGPPGTGKSHLSVAMADALNESFKKAGTPKSVLFMPTARLFSKIKSSFNGGSGFTEEFAVDFLTKVDYLFLDDVGKESSMSTQIKPASDWVQGVLFNILDMRQTTVINTNFDRDQLLQIYDAALVDRLFKGASQNKQALVWPRNSMSKR